MLQGPPVMHTHWTSMLWSIDNCQNRVPVSLGLSCRPIEVKYFFEVIRWLLVTRFQMIAGSSLIFLKIHMKYVFVWRTIKILILNWPRTRKFSQLLQAGKTVALLSMVTRWSRSTSISDWSKFEFMRKIYAASWILFTWTAEADRALCQLVTFLTVFFLRF